MSTARTNAPLLPPTAIGLAPSEARRRYRRHTLLMLVLFLLSWVHNGNRPLSSLPESGRLQ